MGELDYTDRTADLAAVLGVSPTTFARVFGAGWRVAPGPPPHDFDSDPSGGLEAQATPWHLGGAPAQLMVRVFGHGVFLAMPDGSFAGGTHDLRYWPLDQRYIAREEIETAETETAVRDLLRRRRASFRYCRYCRRPTPPELLTGDSCMGCAFAWDGVVY